MRQQQKMWIELIIGSTLLAAIGAANIHIMTPFTYRVGGFNTPIGHDDLVNNIAAILAARHCETKNDTLVETHAEDCNGLEFSITVSDTEYEPASTVNQFLKLESGIDFVIGAASSSVSMPLAIVAGALDKPVMSFYSTSQQLSNRESFSKFARTIPSDAETAFVLASLLHQYRLTSVGLFYLDDAYGNAYRDALLSGCSEKGISLVSYGYNPERLETVETAIKSLRDEALNVLIFVAYGEPAVVGFDLAFRFGMVGEGKLIIFSDAVGVSTLSGIASLSSEHAQALHRQQAVLATGGDSSNPRFLAFQKQWPTLGDDPVMLKYINDRLPGGGMFRANEHHNNLTMQVDSSFFRETVALLETIAPFAYDAVSGACRAMCLANKRTGSISGTNTFAEIERDTFSFEGTSGRVEINPSTGSRSASSVIFKLFSLKSDSTSLGFDIAAKWNCSKWEFQDLVFPPGQRREYPTTTDIPVHQMNQIPLGWKVTLYVVMGGIEALCAILIVWTLQHKKETIVVKSQPQFLIICLVGVMLSTASIYFLSVDDSAPHTSSQASFACNAMWVFWSCGSTAVTAALIVKLYRIYRIFDNPSLRTLRISNMDLYKKIGALLSVDVLILSVWFSLWPLKWVRNDTFASESSSFDKFGNVLDSYGYCAAPAGGQASTYAGLSILALMSFNFSLFVVAAVLAYKVRHVDSDFQESLYIFAAIFSMLQLHLLGVPVFLAISPRDTTVRFLVLAGLIALNNLVFTLLLMVPKVYKFDISSAFGSGSKQRDNGRTTCTTKGKSSNRQTEEIYTVTDDNCDEYNVDFSSFQRPSLDFSEMYPTTRSQDQSGKATAIA